MVAMDHDHVVPVLPGTFSAEWHVKLVFKNKEGNPAKTLAKTGVGGEPLTSAAAIKRAEKADIVTVHETEAVFTCPVRPHGPHHSE